jgi:hypothetical protein
MGLTRLALSALLSNRAAPQFSILPLAKELSLESEPKFDEMRAVVY